MNKLTIAVAVGLAGAASAANLRAENQITVSNRAFLAYAKEKYDCTVAGNDLEATAREIQTKAGQAKTEHIAKCAAADQAFNTEQTNLKTNLDNENAKTDAVKAEEFQQGNNQKHQTADQESKSKKESRENAADTALGEAQTKLAGDEEALVAATAADGAAQTSKSQAIAAHDSATTDLEEQVPASKARLEADLKQYKSDLDQEMAAAEELAAEQIKNSENGRQERKNFCAAQKKDRQAVIDADNKALGTIKPLLAKLAANGCQNPSDLTSAETKEGTALLETASHMTAELQAKCDAITAQILMNGPSAFLQMTQKSGEDPTHAFSASFSEWSDAVAADQDDADKTEKDCEQAADDQYNDEVENKSGGELFALKDNGESAPVRYSGAHKLVEKATKDDAQKKHDEQEKAANKKHNDLEAKLTKAHDDAKLYKEQEVQKAHTAAQALQTATMARDDAVAKRKAAEANKESEYAGAQDVYTEETARNKKLYETDPARAKDTEDQAAFDSATTASKANQGAKAAECAATDAAYDEEISTVGEILAQMGTMSSTAKGAAAR
jgi:hypothetical protein